MAHTPIKIEIIPICAADVVKPLPPRLNAQQAISELKLLNEQSCENEAALALLRGYTAEGFHLVCWPDGTRAAIRTGDGNRIPAASAFTLYNHIRDHLESNLNPTPETLDPAANN